MQVGHQSVEPMSRYVEKVARRELLPEFVAPNLLELVDVKGRRKLEFRELESVSWQK